MANIPTKDGIDSLPSLYPVDETPDRVEAAAKAKGMLIFLRLDHQLEAEKASLSLGPTQLLLVGNPKTGTGWVNTSPSVAINLPLKALAWKDDPGQVWLSHNSPLICKNGITSLMNR